MAAQNQRRRCVNTRPTGSRIIRAAIAGVVLALGIVVGVLELTTPSPVGMDAPTDQFSAGRAVKTVEAIAGSGVPHPGGSADLLRVRQQLLSEIRAIGYEPTLQSGNQTQQWFSEGKSPPINAPQIKSPLTTTAVTNIIVRVPGTDTDTDTEESVLGGSTYLGHTHGCAETFPQSRPPLTDVLEIRSLSAQRKLGSKCNTKPCFVLHYLGGSQLGGQR